MRLVPSPIGIMLSPFGHGSGVARCPLMIQDRNRRADFRKVDRTIRLAGREGREILLPWQLKPCLRVKLGR